MKPVYQTIFGEPLGNCLQASTASIFELPLEAVPNFNEFGNEWIEKFEAFCRERGVYTLRLSPRVKSQGLLKGYHLVHAITTRGLGHTLVALGCEIVHDPYPGGSVITEIEEYEIFVSLMEMRN